MHACFKVTWSQCVTVPENLMLSVGWGRLLLILKLMEYLSNM